MKPSNSSNTRVFEDKAFLLLVIAVSLAFAWILWPFFGAVFWAIVLAILFSPLYRRLLTPMPQRKTLAALATLTIILVMVILPLGLITALLLQEGFNVYERMQKGELNFSRYFREIFDLLPAWIVTLMDRFGLTNLGAVQEKLSPGLMKGIQSFSAQALNIGQNTFEFIVSFFIMLYLLFFFLRDGRVLLKRISGAMPLDGELQHTLADKFATVIRATVKGNFVVAVLQGALGGLIFWFLGIHAALLWAVLMAFLSLLPAVGAALVWLPAAIYFLVTGSIWQGVVLIAYGVLVIGLVDNILRPILVGKDTKLPDYVVLISTLGGLAIFGLNGFVIGPVIAAMFVAVWHVVASSKADARSLTQDAS